MKMVREIDKLDTQLKEELLIDKTTEIDNDDGSDQYNYLAHKVGKQNRNLNKANELGKEITTTQDRTREELYRQRNKLTHTNEVVGEVEQTLSVLDQITQVMNN